MNAYAVNKDVRIGAAVSVEAEVPVDPCVAVVVSDARICQATCALLEAHGVETEPCPDAASLLFLLRDKSVDAIVLDADLPGMDALAFFTRLSLDSASPGVVLLAEAMSVSAAVACLRQGAVSVLEKPFSPPALVADVRAAVALTCDARHRHALRVEGARQLKVLSPRERETFDLLVAGLATQAIADSLGIALQTAKLHRSRVMQKMGTKSVADLVRLEAQVRGVDLSFDLPRTLRSSATPDAMSKCPSPAAELNRISPALAYA
jgi:FixJ family two-component response regulator